MALQIRRGTNAERLGITLVEGEVVYVTDFELVTIEVTSVNASTNTLTTTLNHGLAVNDQIRYMGVTSNGLTEGAVYFVKAIPSQTDFTLSTTQGGTILDITGTATSLVFAVGPTDGLGIPYGYSISPLYVGDGVTAGGNPAGAGILDDLYDVSIGVYGNVGQYGIALANNHVLQYNDITNQWENRADLTLNGENIYINFDSTSNNSNVYFKGTSEYIRYNNSTGFFEFSNSIARGDLFITSTGTGGTISTNVGGLSLNTPVGQVVAVNRDLTVGGDVTVSGNDIKSSGGTTAITLSGNNVTVPGDLGVNGGDLTTTSGVGNLFNANATTVNIGNGATVEVNLGSPASGRVQIKSPLLETLGDAIIAGNLTVNGTTTTVNSTTLTVDDKNIELAATASPSDATADGGGITIKGTTDKKIFWDNATDRWYYDNGDGTNNIFVRDLTDLSSVNTGPFVKGDIFHFNGTEWTNSNKIQADTSTQRTIFQYNNNDAGTTPSSFFARRNFTSPSAFAAGDGTGIAFQLSNDNGAPTTFAGITGVYGTTPSVNLRTSTDNFASNNVIVASFDNDAARIGGANLILNADNTGAASDSAIVVERGSSSGSDASLAWIEAAQTWIASSGLIGANYIGTNGLEIIFNNDDGALNSTDRPSLLVKRGSGSSVALRWNEDTDRWETTTNGSTYINIPNQGLDTGNSPVFAGAQLGNVQVGVTTDNEIDTTSGNLTIDSAGGTTTIDDAVVISGDLTHNGSSATFNNNLTIGSDSTDTLTVNSTATFNNNLTIGSDSTDTLTVNSTATFNNDLTIGSSNADTVTITSLVAGDISFTDNSTTTNRGVKGSVGTNDFWQYGGGATASDAGYAEIRTGDNGTEPIYVRQFTGASATTTLTLLDGSNNTSIPNNLTTNGDVFIENNKNLYISGSTLVLNNNDTAGGTVDIKSYRGVAGATSAGIRWNETSDRWQTTVDNSVYLNIPNQNLDTADSPTFAGGTFGNITVGVATDNTIASTDTNGNITLTPNGTGTVVISKIDVASGEIDNTVIGANVAAAGTFTTVNATNIEVTNIKAKDGTAAIIIADSTGVVTVSTALQVDNINISGNTISSTDTNGNIVLDTNGTGVVDVAGAFVADSISTEAQFYKDLAGDEIAATIARTTLALDGTTDVITIASTNRKAMKVMVVVNNQVNTHVIEALVMRDSGEASGAQVTFYGELRTGSALATFTADYDAGTSVIRLRAEPAGVVTWPIGDDFTFKVVRTALF